jgi:hypothetical protein
VMFLEMLPEVAGRLHLRGYLIGNLGRGVPGCPPPTDEEISAGDAAGTATMPSPLDLAVMAPNLGFPGLSRFRECRRRPPSQLLQIATLAYI